MQNCQTQMPYKFQFRIGQPSIEVIDQCQPKSWPPINDMDAPAFATPNIFSPAFAKRSVNIIMVLLLPDFF